MKIKRLYSVIAILSILSVFSVGYTISAEETVTEADTSVSAEETTTAVKSTIVGELNVFDEWTGDDFSKTIELSAFGYDFGVFTGLMLNDTVIDSSNYTVSQNGNESITFTINEAFMSTLSEETNYFTADFENITLQPAFAINISKVEEDTTEASTTAVVSSDKTESPKTGNKDASALLGLLTVSGLVAFVSKKKI